MRILKDLFYGNVSPLEQRGPCSRQMEKTLRKINEMDEKLQAILSEEQRDIFEKFKTHSDERVCLAEQDMFIEGFKLGARMTFEIMGDEPRKR